MADADSELMVTHAVIEPTPVAALAALFDDGLEVPGRGDELPPMWHWVAMARWAGVANTGSDGHQRTGGFLPDVGKPRRMFAGGSIDFHGPLIIGDKVRREDRVVAVTPKQGRQGDFVLVETECKVFDLGGRLLLSETQNLIYRDEVDPAQGGAWPASTPAPLPTVSALLKTDGGKWSFQTDPTKLVRFSSATSNGHRIHYDLAYATQVEGYLGLVVHGPLMSLALAEVLRLEGVKEVRRVSHRNLRPLFCGIPAEVAWTAEGSVQSLSVRGAEGPYCTVEVVSGQFRS